jgi:hypothetical protein
MTGATVESGFAACHPLDHDAIKSNRIMISSLCLSMIFFGKPVSTFPDHALGFEHLAADFRYHRLE